MRDVLFAWTAPGANFPPYVNISREGDITRIAVRGPGGNPSDPTVQIDVPNAAFDAELCKSRLEASPAPSPQGMPSRDQIGEVLHAFIQFLSMDEAIDAILALLPTSAPAPSVGGEQPVHPTAAYMCGCCGIQWYDGIQQDCGHHKNERAYCKASPCVAVLKPEAEALLPAREPPDAMQLLQNAGLGLAIGPELTAAKPPAPTLTELTEEDLYDLCLGKAGALLAIASNRQSHNEKLRAIHGFLRAHTQAVIDRIAGGEAKG